MLLLIAAASSRAEDRGFIDNVWYDIHGIVPTSSGALFEVGRNILDVSPDGEVKPFLRWPFQLVRFAGSRDGFLFIGRTEKKETQPFIDFVFKTDRDGKVLWGRKVYAEDATDDHDRVWLKTIAETPDGVIIVAGTHRGANVVEKFSKDGAVAWQKRIAQSTANDVGGMILTRDGGVFITGSVGRYGTLVRLGPDGSLVDRRVFVRPNGTTHFHEAVELANGGFLVVGAEQVRDGDANALLMRLDAHGAIVWQKTMGGGWGDEFIAIASNGANRFDILGYTFSFAETLRNWLITIDGDGSAGRQLAIAGGDTLGGGGGIVGDGARGVWAAFRDKPNHIVRITDETNCDSVSETNVQFRPGMLVELERAMEFGDDDARIDPYEVPTETPVRFGSERACAAPGGARARLAVIPALPETEELRVLLSASRMLAEKKFDALDALANKLRKGHERFDSGEWKLSWFYQGFQPESQPLVRLGVAGVERLLEEWVHTTNSRTSRTALASFELDVAWRVRGGGFWNSIVEEAGKEFETRRTRAIEILEKLDEEGRCDAHCLELTIVAEQRGGWTAPLRKLVRIEPAYWDAFSDAANYLRPQWGGSYDEVEKFAREAADATRLIFGDAMYAVVVNATPFKDDEGKVPNYDWDRFCRGLHDFQRLNPKSATSLHTLAFFAWRHGDQKTAREAFENPLLQWDRRRSQNWPGRKMFELVRSWALGPPAPPPYSEAVPSLVPKPPPPVPEPVPAPPPPAAPVKKQRGTIATALDIAIDGRRTRAVAFVVKVGAMRFPVSVLERLSNAREHKVTISCDGKSLPAVGVANDENSPRAIVTLPDAALNVEPLLMTGAPPVTHQDVTIVGCRVTRGVCVETVVSGRISAVERSETGPTVITGFDLNVPAIDDVVVTGAPALDANDHVLGIVHAIDRVGSGVVLHCHSLVFALSAPRTTMALSPK